MTDTLLAEADRLFRAGKYTEAIPFAQQVLAIQEKAHGPDHPDVAASLNYLALLSRLQGRFGEAEPLFKRSLAIREKTLGADHPDVATSLYDLAELYRLQGRFFEAEPLFKRSLALREKALGQDHPIVATSLNNLALLHQAQGRFGEAEALHRRSLAIREKVLGPDHSAVAMSLNNLALLNLELGRFGEVEALFKRSLAISEKALGSDHPHVATLLNNLAELYRLQGRLGEAEPLFKRSFALREKALGADHPDVAISLNNLALLHQAQGRFGEVEALFKRSLAISEKALGPDHPNVATLLNNLAVLYQTQGRFGEAEPLFKRSLVLREKTLGHDHPDVAASLNSLAGQYQGQGRFDEAEPLHRRSLAIRERALGPDHPDVAAPLNNLALLHQAQGRFGDAEPLLKRGLAISEKALGPDHSDVATSLNNLAELYRRQGRLGEAEPLFKRSLAIREKALGPDHPDVATSLNNLALLHQTQGRFAVAEALYKRSLALIERALGPDHPDVTASLDNLASIALSLNDLTGAAGHWRRATAVLQRRAQRGLGGNAEGSSKGEAQRRSWYFEGLVKATFRLVSEGREAAAQRAAATFETAQWATSSGAATSLSQMAARSAGGSPTLASLVRERQDLVVEWQGKDRALIGFRSEPPQKRDATAEWALSDRLAAIDRRLVEIDATLAKNFADYADLASPKPIGVAEVQAALGGNEALVLFLDTDAKFKPLPEETFVWVVTKADVRWVRSDLGTAALRREVAALRCGLDATAWHGEGARRCADLLNTPLEKAPRQGEPLPFDTARAHALYTSLLGEAVAIIKGKHLLVVPSGALTTLPFQVLVTRSPKSKDLASIRWLARDHAITVLPSVTALKSLRRVGRPSAAPKPMIGFANPLLDGNQAHPADGAYLKELAQKAKDQTACAKRKVQRSVSLRGLTRSAAPVRTISGLANLDHLRMQTPLPETADEVCAVARSLGADVREMRIGAAATETEVKRLSHQGELARYRILHFATHGLLAGQLSGTREPGLILTPPETATADDDGYLSGGEIAALKLDADWVILSACNTAGGGGQDEAAEALSGLARVFFYGGTRALLVSHWEVESDAAVALITGAVGELAKSPSIGRGEALRRAMLAMTADTSRPASWIPAAHPSVWAAFVVVGEGGVGR